MTTLMSDYYKCGDGTYVHVPKMSYPTPTIGTMKTIKLCPEHEGAFDCTPFCRICEGNQEYESDGYLPCNRFGQCATYVEEDVWHEELGFCQPCQAMYFNQKLDPFTLEKVEQ
jgi:hypothetical protein